MSLTGFHQREYLRIDETILTHNLQIQDYVLIAVITVITVGKSAMVELIIYTIDIQKIGHIRCYRQNIGILTSDPEST